MQPSQLPTPGKVGGGVHTCRTPGRSQPWPAVLHNPQWATVSRLCSQPLSAVASQSPKPRLHVHMPCSHTWLAPHAGLHSAVSAVSSDESKRSDVSDVSGLAMSIVYGISGASLSARSFPSALVE